MRRFLDQFSVLLLDMNGTFVFGHDRLGPNEDYFSTYRCVGGRNLARDSVLRIVNTAVDSLWCAYRDPACVDDFPSVAEVLAQCSRGVEHDEISILEDVIAIHEFGSVPPEHDKFLRDVAQTHGLAIVSNLWSRPDRWLSTFRDSALLNIFKAVVFSSQGRSIKPSRLLFNKALAAFPAESSVLFIGDSLERDIMPAKALGLSTAWIAPLGSVAHAAADVVVGSLPELFEVAADLTNENR
jgi:putative hydrolase of the HAD superfamily